MNDSDFLIAPNADSFEQHGPEGFEGMRKAGRLAAECLDLLVPMAQPGVTSAALDKMAYEFAMDNGALPACLGYRGYRHTTCISINHVICHGIPSQKPIKEGDIANIDVTLIVDGWHGDTSRMFYFGEPSVLAKRLTDVTFESLWKGIEVVKPGATLRDIGAAIQTHAEAAGFSVVRDFCGHGVGRQFHTSPNIVHYASYKDRNGLYQTPATKLVEGMFFTIEPMINSGRPDAKIKRDGWTAVTRDRSLSAQFEHCIGVTRDGYEVFTQSPKGLDRPPYKV